VAAILLSVFQIVEVKRWSLVYFGKSDVSVNIDLANTQTMVMPLATLLVYMCIIYSIQSAYVTCGEYGDSTNLMDWL